MSEILDLPVALGLNWLALTHIRQADGNLLGHGGLKQGYDSVKHRYPYIYSEITGYGISLFVNAYRWTGDAFYLKLAKEAADFIIRIMTQVKEETHRGSVPHGYSLPDYHAYQQYFSFDAAMCMQGLLDLHALQPSSELIQAAWAIGNWLVSKMQREDGAFLSLYNAETGEFRHSGKNFFDDYGCLHAKHAIGLLKINRLSGDARFLEAVWRVCNWVLTLQDPDGGIQATERQPQVVSHAHCYAVEGLLYAHAILGEERYLRAAIKGGEWLRVHQGKNGAILIGYEHRWWRMDRKIHQWLKPIQVSDATAQAIRIWLILYEKTGQMGFLQASQRAVAFLISMQCRQATDPDKVGGFYFHPGNPFQYTWCTMFAVHALYAASHMQREDGYWKLIEELF